MLYQYKARDSDNTVREGTVEATSLDSAMRAVKGRGYQLISIDVASEKSFFGRLRDQFDVNIAFFNTVQQKDLVIMSRQVATLFEAQVSPLRIFQLLSTETENVELKRVMMVIASDLQAGSSLSRAFAQHPHVFSLFYVNLIKAGEETGSLENTFNYLADYLDRTYEMTAKAKSALVYPAFVILVFILVMTLMLTLVIPNITEILLSSGQELPFYTEIVMGISDFFVNYIGLLFVALSLGGIGLWKFSTTEPGRRAIDELKIKVPYVGTLNEKLYLTRICDNLSTMVAGGVQMVQAIEITAEVVDNVIYQEMLEAVAAEVRAGRSFADAIAAYPMIPGILSQMAKVGEETGALPDILKTLSKFYRREVYQAVDALISLIEPAMILLLGAGVGTLLASVLIPIYDITTTI